MSYDTPEGDLSTLLVGKFDRHLAGSKESMETIRHWKPERNLTVAHSRSGIRVTASPLDNLVRGAHPLWPTPELLQKFYGNDRFKGRTPEDDAHARSGLGHYCDLQSLNSEDAVTFSFFGTLQSLGVEDRRETIGRLFERLGLPPLSPPVTTWLWRRLPHPEKVASTGGPEIDFGLLSTDTLVLGESKWNSPLGDAQGVNKDRTQLDLRLAYCAELGPKALCSVCQWVVLGIARRPDLLAATTSGPGTKVVSLCWQDLPALFPPSIRAELEDYLAWKDEFSSAVV